jgi:hypothetical protein
LETAKESLDQYANVIAQVRAAVQSQMELELEQFVRQNMFSEHKEALFAGLVDGLKAPGGKGTLSSEVVTSIFKKTLGEQYFDVFWQRVVDATAGTGAQRWAEKIKDQQAALGEVFQGFQAEAWGALRQGMNPAAIQSQISAIAGQTLDAGIKASLGIAAAATAYAAWLGPQAAAVSIGAAATGVGLPLALLGVSFTYLYSKYQRDQQEEKSSEYVQSFLETCVNEFIEQVLRPHLLPRLEQVNKAIEQALVQQFRDALGRSLPSNNIENLLEEARRHLNVLSPRDSCAVKILPAQTGGGSL